MLTQAIQDYLKIIYKLRRGDEGVSTTAIADGLSLSAASVTNMIKKLARLRLVEHTPYRGVVLTPGGEKVALEVIRHHRLLELYLSDALGVSLDKVDEEAERLEHVLSEDLEERIAQTLGDPTHDPHGHPIPSREGRVDDLPYPALADLASGESAVIVHVSDRDAAVARALDVARPRDVVCVTGSFYLAGEARDRLLAPPASQEVAWGGAKHTPQPFTEGTSPAPGL